MKLLAETDGMVGAKHTRKLSAILCADWGKEKAKRSIYVADVESRIVRRVSAEAWSVTSVLAQADRLASTGSALATFDVPIGVPTSYLLALSSVSGLRQPATFLDLLTQVRSLPRFYDATILARDWSLERPFFAVPAGHGGLRTYIDAAARLGVDLYRETDRATGAKALFIKSGVPGSVGSAACSLWQELSLRLTAHRRFRVWPFEGDLSVLLESTPVVVGEMYPRAAYATALLDVPPMSRAILVVPKTDPSLRQEAIAMLRAAKWVQALSVQFEDLGEAEANEDDFDACLTAAALLRCVLGGEPLFSAQTGSPASEGAMLGTGSVNLSLPHRTFAGRQRARLIAQPTRRPTTPVELNHPAKADVEGRVKVFACPIAGCKTVFRGSRGGWDGHVGSLRLHPQWHPELVQAEDRKAQFKTDFPMFFR